MPKQLPLYLVDAFAARPFVGNPAAVCLLEVWPQDAWLQQVAVEMNQSETAFLVREGDGYRLRWFTPGAEVELCGHATLASAHALWSEGIVAAGLRIQFTTLSGVLSATPQGDEIELDFPATPPQPADAPPGLLAALGASAVYVGQNRFDYLIEVADERELRALRPDFRRLAEVESRGVIVTARSSDPQFDFVSRFFAPKCGIDEDPVTGSAHCALGPFWQERLGKEQFQAYQASPRGGVVGVLIDGDRIRLRGRAVTVVRGQITGPD